VLFPSKNKTNHENTKLGKHEILILFFSRFRVFVIKNLFLFRFDQYGLTILHMTIKEKLKKLIVETLHLEDIRPEEIENDEPLFGEKLGLDSIDAVEIVFQVEQHFGVGIKNMKEGRPALQSINTLAAFIEARL